MLLTRAEATGYRETSLHADVMAFVAGLEALGDPRLHTGTFGVSPQGRALPWMVLSTRGVKTPEDAVRAGLPVVLMLDGIHPGEVEGKEASLAMVRDALQGSADWLEHLTLLVVPLFNPDGNDALDPANRKLDLSRLSGQIGPVVGTRVQSQGVNLNRDYMRQQTSEMRLLQAEICQRWSPHLTIDNHATNGSVHRFHMTVDVPHTVESGRREPIELMRRLLVPEVTAQVRKRGFESGWYGNFVEDERQLDAAALVDPTTPVSEGWMTYPHNPRFGSNYRGLTNRCDLLLECYSYLPFDVRVQVARAWQEESLAWVAQNGESLVQTTVCARMPPRRVAVRYGLRTFEEPVEILTRSPRTLEGEPTSVKLPYYGRFEGTKVVERPGAYLVPPALAEALRRHGLRVDPAPERAEVDVARVVSRGGEDGRAILEAARVGELAVEWRREERALPPGSGRVVTEQPLGAVAVYLCEPESDDSAAENGFLPVPGLGEEWGAFREA